MFARRKLGSTLFTIAVTLVVLAGTRSPADAETPFAVQTLDAVATSGYAVSMVLDVSGDPHVAFLRSPGSMVRYAHRSGGVWTTEDIAPGKPFATAAAIALDASGTPVVAFVRDLAGTATDSVCLATRTGSGWSIEAVDVAPAYLDLAIDAADRVHLVYRQNQPGSSFRLRYARRTGSTWTFETADTAYTSSTHASSFEGLSLALDGANEPAVAFHTGPGDRKLGYARRIADSWVVSEPDPTPCSGFLPDLRFNPLGVPQISFLAGYAGEIRLASDTGSGWAADLVDAASWSPNQCFVIGYNSSLVHDPSGAARVTYSRIEPDGLVFAADAPGGWVTQAVEPGIASGLQSALVLSASGWPMIAYFSSLGLRFAEATGPIVGVTPAAPSHGFALLPPAPNPVGAGRTLTLRFALPRAGQVAVAVTDVSGRSVWSRPTRPFAAGAQSLALELPALRSGVYYARLAAAGLGVRVARFVVLD